MHNMQYEVMKRLPADYYDYIVIDETHHAAADSYAEALEAFHPQVLLGLTATAERMDGKSILRFFVCPMCASGR